MENFSIQLPNDIIDLFGKKLNSIEDFISFGSVCKSWHQSFTRIKKKHAPFSPLLMLAYNENLQDIQTFFSFSTKKNLNLPLPKALIQDRRCLGSPFGWLVTIGLDLRIHLLNPISQIQISLPSQPTFNYQYKCSMEPEDLRRMFVFKFVLSSNPSEETSCVVMAIYSQFCKLAFAKPGDETWISIESSRQDYTDAIFFQGQFYAVSSKAVLEICDINTPSPKAIKFASPPDGVESGNRYYLVEMSGDLLLVERHIVGNGKDSAHEFHYYTFASQVYKFNFEKKSWTELSDLGDNALFIGTNTSYAISTSDYPEFRCNCIYFTDDHLELYCDNSLCDMGLFDLTDGTEDEEEDVTVDVETVEPIYTGDNMISTFSRPLFIMPSF